MAEEAQAAPAQQDKPQEQSAPDPSQEQRSGTTDEKPDTFDPASLPDELLPAYKQLQAAYTRKFQEAASLRNPDHLASYLRTLDPEAQQAVLQQAGYVFDQEDEEDYDDYSDSDDELRAQLEDMQAWRQSLEQNQADSELEDMLIDSIDDQLGQLEEATGRTLNEDEAMELGQIAYDRSLASGQVPDVKQVYESVYTKLLPKERQRWVQSKKTPQVQSGSSASHQPNLDDPKEREEYMARRWADAIADSQG